MIPPAHTQLAMVGVTLAVFSTGCDLGDSENLTTSANPLVFEPLVFEYKADPAEKEFTATFRVRNDGQTPISITKLDSSCTCLSVTSDREEIDPGGESMITALFDITKLAGEAEKSVYVETDHPGAEMQRLGVRVSVPAIVEVKPTVLEWAVGEKPAAKAITFEVVRDKPIRILEATSSRRQVSCELETVEEGRSYRIVLTPESTENVLLGFVKIVTDCELEQHKRQMAYFAVKDPD